MSSWIIYPSASLWFRDKYFQIFKHNAWDRNNVCGVASSDAWSFIQQAWRSSQNSKQIVKISKYSLAKPLGTKTIGCQMHIKPLPALFCWHCRKPKWQVKKIAISASVTCFEEGMMQTSLCICGIGWVPGECKRSGSFSLHSPAPMQSTPPGWCSVCYLVWGSGRMWASSNSCCQLHWVSLAPSFMLCLTAPCVRAVAVTGAWSAFSLQHLQLLGFASCHQDILSSSRSQIHIA